MQHREFLKIAALSAVGFRMTALAIRPLLTWCDRLSSVFT